MPFNKATDKNFRHLDFIDFTTITITQQDQQLN